MIRFLLAMFMLLALVAPGFATTLDERIAADENAVHWMEWVEICTTDKPWRWSDAERLKVCLILEQQLRDHGRCMYGPGVIGIWNGKHCR